MSKVITFLCVNPAEFFLQAQFSAFGRRQYEQMLQVTRYWPYQIQSDDYCRCYGEAFREFPETEKGSADYQFHYVQTQDYEIISRAFRRSDLVVFVVQGNLSDFDRIFSKVYRWKEKILIVWNRPDDSMQNFAKKCQLSADRILKLHRTADEALKEASYLYMIYEILSRIGSECYGRHALGRSLA